MHLYTYLALGDSYTIGEGVLIHKSFPYQVVNRLRQADYAFTAPEIIARTGWTTSELAAALEEVEFLSKYDFVTLLAGVNNQYRGLDAIQYKEEFEALLQKAISLTNSKKEHVIVVSIPDYSPTPYAEKMDREKIAREIDVFNSINRALSIQYKTEYLDITTHSRTAGSTSEMLVADGLHPSSAVYDFWSEKLSELIASKLK